MILKVWTGMLSVGNSSKWYFDYFELEIPESERVRQRWQSYYINVQYTTIFQTFSFYEIYVGNSDKVEER